MMRSSVVSGWCSAPPWRRTLSPVLSRGMLSVRARRRVVVACSVVAGAAIAAPAAKDQAAAPGVASRPRRSRAPRRDAEGRDAWIADDYPAALACAKQKKLPLVIDLWAPWCHTCLSMQTTVFTDPSFAARRTTSSCSRRSTPIARRTPRRSTKLAISAWPTFYVIGARREPCSRGSSARRASRSSTTFLDAGVRRRTRAASPAPTRTCSAPSARSRSRTRDRRDRADARRSRRHRPTGCAARRPRLADLDEAQARATTPAASTSRDEAHGRDRQRRGASDFLVDRDRAAPTSARRPSRRGAKTLRERAVDAAGSSCSPTRARRCRSTIAPTRWRTCARRSTRSASKDEAKAIAEAQRALLDDAAAKAPTPLAAMTYNWPRAEVYVYLGKPLDLVPALEKSATDLPKEYDPPRAARLDLLQGRQARRGREVDRQGARAGLRPAQGPPARAARRHRRRRRRQGDRAKLSRGRREAVRDAGAEPAGARCTRECEESTRRARRRQRGALSSRERIHGLSWQRLAQRLNSPSPRW